jgi:ATP-binding cassette subfamily B protein RaxB
MALSLWGLEVPLHLLRQQSGGDAAGASSAELSRAAALHGLHCRFRRLTLEELASGPFPALAHWRGSHWVLVLGVNGGKLQIADPAEGLSEIPVDAASGLYSGVAAPLHMRPGGVKPEISVLRALAPYLKIQASHLPLALLASLLSGGSLIALILVFGDWLDQTAEAGPLGRHLVWISFSLAGILCGQSLRLWHSLNCGSRIDRALLDHCAEQLARQPAASAARQDEVLRRVERSLEIRAYLVDGVSELLQAVIVLAGVVVALDLLKAPLIPFLWLAPMLLLLLWISERRGKSLNEKISSLRLRLMRLQQDCLACGEDLRGSARLGPHLETTAQLNAELLRQIQKEKRLGGLQDLLGLCAGLAAFFLAALFHSESLALSDIGQGRFLVFVLLAPLGCVAAVRLLGLRARLQRSARLLADLEDFLSIGGSRVENGAGSGSFRLNLIAAEAQTCQLEVKQGERIFLHGPGATALIRRIAGLESPFVGDLEEIPGGRDGRSWLGQSSALLGSTLARNIDLGVQESDENACRRALRDAAADEALLLPGGLQARLGSGGWDLPVDLERRVLLARALCRRPGLILLEEPSHGQDEHQVLVLRLQLSERLQGSTLVLVDQDSRLAAACHRSFYVPAPPR